MTPHDWEIIASMLVSGVLTVGSWMFMVHAKLAVIAARLVDLGDKVEKAAEANQELWRLCAQHQARLETHDVQFSHIVERLENVE